MGIGFAEPRKPHTKPMQQYALLSDAMVQLYRCIPEKSVGVRWKCNTGNRNTNRSFVLDDFSNTPTTLVFTVVVFLLGYIIMYPWLFHSVFMVVIAIMFGCDIGVIVGTYLAIWQLLITRFVRGATEIVEKQRDEIERLRNA